MTEKHRILFVYNAVTDSVQQQYLPQLMSLSQIENFDQALNDTGYEIVHLNLYSPEQLKDFVLHNGPFDIAFCIAEGFLSQPMGVADGSGAAKVRQVLADLKVNATHSSAFSMEICWHKNQTYQVLGNFGIPIPKYHVIYPRTELASQLGSVEADMPFPLFVKPAAGGTSLGISEDSLVYSPQELERQVQTLLAEFKDLPVLVETYLPGREYTVGIIGNREKRILPIIVFPTKEKVRTFNTKRSGDKSGQEKIGPDDPRYQLLAELAGKVFDAVGAQDVLRVDLKEDDQGRPMVIDVNGSPTFTPTASLAKMAAWEGLTYNDLVKLFLNTALQRIRNPGVRLPNTVGL